MQKLSDPDSTTELRQGGGLPVVEAAVWAQRNACSIAILHSRLHGERLLRG